MFVDIHLRVAGELPPELGNLVNLEVLDLSRNRFTGTIVHARVRFADITSIRVTIS